MQQSLNDCWHIINVGNLKSYHNRLKEDYIDKNFIYNTDFVVTSKFGKYEPGDTVNATNKNIIQVINDAFCQTDVI